MGMCAIKVDFRKSYDSINWSFILMYLRVCITSHKYSIAFNGGLKWYFKDGKGIRQGDPVSPYLFVLTMVNQIMLSKVAASQKFKFHPSCASQKIIHVSFADDLLLLAEADIPFLLLLQEALGEFKNLLGFL